MIKVIKPGRNIDQDMFRILCWNCDCEFTYQREDLIHYMGYIGVYCPNCHEFHEHSICNLVIKKCRK